ncbi:hypothetical protein STEG23_006794, partial [Scotinomys teguina]
MMVEDRVDQDTVLSYSSSAMHTAMLWPMIMDQPSGAEVNVQLLGIGTLSQVKQSARWLECIGPEGQRAKLKPYVANIAMNLWGRDLLKQWNTQINIPPASETNQLTHVSERNTRRIVRETPISGVRTFYTDANKQGKAGYKSEDLSKVVQSPYNSVQKSELYAILLVLMDFSEPLNIVTDSQYAERVVLHIETAEFIPDESELTSLFIQLQDIIRNRKHPLYITHIRSHTGLPGPLAQGNDEIDKLLIGNVLEASEFHKKHHVNSKGLKRDFSITWQQAKEIVRKCPTCSFYNQTPLPAGCNPKGTQRNDIWQMDVFHFAEFGKLKYVHHTIDTYSGFQWATALSSEKADSVIMHLLEVMAIMGIPAQIKTDNAPAYVSGKMKQFFAYYNIKHITGNAECAVETDVCECRGNSTEEMFIWVINNGTRQNQQGTDIVESNYSEHPCKMSTLRIWLTQALLIFLTTESIGQIVEPCGYIYPEFPVVQRGSNFTAICVLKEKCLQQYDVNASFIVWKTNHVAVPKEQVTVINRTTSSVTFKDMILQTVQLTCNVLSFGQIEQNVYGTTVLSGFPPNIPTNLSCIVNEGKNMLCQWDPGRETYLETNYTLKSEWATEKFPDCLTKHGTSCMVSYPPIYFVNIEVWVEAENALGKVSSEGINFDPVDKVKPNPPHNLSVSNSEELSSILKLTWINSGFGNSIRLKSDIQYRTKDSSTWIQVPLEDTESPRTSFTIQDLKPFTEYVFRIRSIKEDGRGYWSDWSEESSGITYEDRPSKPPSFWYKINTSHTQESRTVQLIWKELPLSEANGKILDYEVILTQWKSFSQNYTINGTELIVNLTNSRYIASLTARNKVGKSDAAVLTIPSSHFK